MPYRKEKSPERSFAQDSEPITQDLQLLRHGFNGANIHRSTGCEIQRFVIALAVAGQVAGLVPDDDLSITSWNVLDLELAIFIGDSEIWMIEAPAEALHPGM